MNRVVTNAILVILAIFSPWWLSVAALIACAFYFSSFYEMLAYGLALDAMFGSPADPALGIYFPFSVGAAAVLFGVMYAKNKMVLRI